MTADAPPDLTIGVKSRVGYLAAGASTDGQFGLYRWDMAAIPNGPGAHFHRTFSESFFVLEGTVSLYDGERWLDATPALTRNGLSFMPRTTNTPYREPRAALAAAS
ncbi:hypothetical protein ACIBO2_28170 [Nonomuraea sp. NPDC050022]|uniref:hypothetical protein n=1 Tax=unclassified Nonomuraea TaxID=2593643 RepID=UPI0033E047FF